MHKQAKNVSRHLKPAPKRMTLLVSALLTSLAVASGAGAAGVGAGAGVSVGAGTPGANVGVGVGGGLEAAPGGAGGNAGLGARGAAGTLDRNAPNAELSGSGELRSGAQMGVPGSAVPGTGTGLEVDGRAGGEMSGNLPAGPDAGAAAMERAEQSLDQAGGSAEKRIDPLTGLEIDAKQSTKAKASKAKKAAKANNVTPK